MGAVRWFAGTAQNGRITVGDRTYRSLQRGNAWRGCVIYMVDTDWQSVLDMCDSRDTVFGRGRDPGTIGGVSVFCGGKNRYTLMPLTAWGGMATTVSEAEDYLTQIEQDCVEAGYVMGRSATALARKVLRKTVPRGCGVGQLRPQFRSVAHSAVAPGAMSVFRGHADYAVAVDRSQAYLCGLSVPVPIPGTWQPVTGLISDSVLLGCDGFVEATVFIDEDKVVNMPPLSVKRYGFRANPVGAIRGTWPIHVLRWAVKKGHSIVQVHCAAVCDTEPLLEQVRKDCEAIKTKRLRKLVYTRMWGMLSSLGGWRGTVVEGEPHNTVDWFWGGGDYLSHTLRHDYRPDWSAFLVAENAMMLVDVCESLMRGSVCGTHIDCVWTTDTRAREIANRVDTRSSWHIKGRGELRMWGIGQYEHGGELGVQGMQRDETTTREDVESWLSTGVTAAGAALSRDWLGSGYPHDTPDCVSRPLRAGPGGVVGDWLNEPTPDAPIWTPRGWCHKELVDAVRGMNDSGSEKV